jgi:hypothetical protein
VERLSNQPSWFCQPLVRLPFQPVRYYRMILCSIPRDKVHRPSWINRARQFEFGIWFRFYVLEPALTGQTSGGLPESRRGAENGSNRDSSEAVRSGSGGPERPGERHAHRFRSFILEVPVRMITGTTRCDPPGYYQLANSFSGINAISSFMIQ